MRLLPVIIILFFCACSSSGDQLEVAVASNLRLPLEKIVRQYERETNQSIALSSASSGVLCTQIKLGAPIDIFISADANFADSIALKDTLPAQILAYGRLVLWSNLEGEPSLDQLQQRHSIGIANPKTAPFGAAANAFLQSNYPPAIAAQAYQYMSVSDLNKYLYTKSIDIGITSNTARFITNVDTTKMLTLSADLHEPLPQTAVLISNSEPAKHFYEYLYSAESKSIFKSHGYDLDK